MSQQTKEAAVAPDLNPSEANDLRRQQDHLQALCRRFETAAAALSRHCNQLTAQALQGGHCHDGREYDAAHAGQPDPDGGRP
jgi:hypothetical protein